MFKVVNFVQPNQAPFNSFDLKINYHLNKAVSKSQPRFFILLI